MHFDYNTPTVSRFVRGPLNHTTTENMVTSLHTGTCTSKSQRTDSSSLASLSFSLSYIKHRVKLIMKLKLVVLTTLSKIVTYYTYMYIYTVLVNQMSGVLHPSMIHECCV